MIAQHLHALLRAALPPEVPVLLPEQVQEPLTAAPTDAQGRPRVGGGERGLGAYLAQHAGGYVQVEEPLPITSSGARDTYWVTVAAIHTTQADAHALAQQVARTLTGIPGADPGYYRPQTPPEHLTLGPGAHAARATYAITLLLGQLPT